MEISENLTHYKYFKCFLGLTVTMITIVPPSDLALRILIRLSKKVLEIDTKKQQVSVVWYISVVKFYIGLFFLTKD